MAYLAMACVSAAAMAAELLLTRIFGFLFWNHVVYLIITLCLLGYGIASTAVSVIGPRLDRIGHERLVGLCLAGLALSLVGTLFAVSRTSLSIAPDMFRFGSVARLVGLYGVATLPFVFAGGAVLLLLTRDPARTASLYAVDLGGAAIGCVAFVVAMEPLGAARALGAVAAGAVGVAVAHAVRWRDGAIAAACGVAAIGVAPALLAPDVAFPLRAEPTKLLGAASDPVRCPDAVHEVATWTPLMRIDVAHSALGCLGGGLFAPGTDYRALTHDGDAVTFVLRRPATWPTEADVAAPRPHSLVELAYAIRHAPRVLVIGTGGGSDLAVAIEHGAARVDGVELNRITRDLLTGSGRYADYSGRVYERPGVRVSVGEGRSFVRRSREHYDVVQMSGIDTYAALSSGAYVLAENYLYTTDAIGDYLDRLGDDGVMNVFRWYEWERPRETLRVLSIVLEALRARGARDPAAHVFVAAQYWGGATLFKPAPFTDTEIDALHAFSIANGFAIVWTPRRMPEIERIPAGEDPKNPFEALALRYRRGDERAFFDRYPFDVSPIGDDRPFFYEYLKLSSASDLSLVPDGAFGRHVLRSYWAYLVLAIDVVAAIVATCVFVWAPLWAFRRRGLVVRAGGWAAAYFGAIGLGFIGLEVALAQKLALYLGHPMWALSVVVTTLLAATGAGSAIGGRRADPARTVRAAGPAVLALAVGLAAAGPAITHATLGAPFGVRVAVTVALIAPLGALLGVFLPCGLRVVAARARSFAAWAWGINAGATVVGSVGAIALALVAGFAAVIVVSGALYVVAAFALGRYASAGASSDA